MKRVLLAACCLAPLVASAQTSPNLGYGDVLSAGQWNALFTAKTDYPLKAYTVATLPACNSTSKGAMLVVTDATTPTYNAALVGSGAVVVPVFCNGSAWLSH